MIGRIFNIQRFSLDDGDGIRTCVFLKGCPLRCAWCHNAESLSFPKELLYSGKNCVYCRACASVCENSCHSFSDRHAIKRESCVACGKCAEVCPTGALKLIGEDITPEEVIQRVMRDRDYFTGNGGITLTGGEPMAQADFCIAVAKLAKDAGISVMVETSGFCDTKKLIGIMPYVDRFLFDCKASEKDHKRLTGVDDTRIIKNLSEICERGADVSLRCPVIPGANLSEEFLQKIVALTGKYDRISSVTLLPYHKTGLDKSALLGKSAQDEFEVPEKELMEKIGGWLAERINQKIIIK